MLKNISGNSASATIDGSILGDGKFLGVGAGTSLSKSYTFSIITGKVYKP